MSRTVLVLGGALVVALIAVAVLVTYLLTGQSAEKPGPSPSHSTNASPLATVKATPPEASTGPTPMVESNRGIRYPALVAAVGNCHNVWPDNGWAIVEPDMYDIDLLNPPPAIEVRGANADRQAELIADGQDGKDPLEMHRCVLAALGAPGGVAERMRNTRAIDGMQEETWPGYRVTWTYHPDQGLDAVFSYTR